MDRFTEIFAPIIGRVLVGGFFLWVGIEKTLNFSATAQFISSHGVPAPALAAVLVVAVEVLGGIALVAGYRTALTALVLAVFTIATLPLYASFDSEAGVSLFLQTMAIVGGLFYMSAFGSGAWERTQIRRRN